MMSYVSQLPGGLFWAMGTLGAAMVVWSFWLAYQGATEQQETAGELKQLVVWGRGLRVFLIGICLFGGAVGALWQIRWLVLAALVIGLEELYETTVGLFFLRKMVRQSEDSIAAFPLLVPGYDERCDDDGGPDEADQGEERWPMDRHAAFVEDIL